jgi:polyhydroxyalkanoate synthase
MTRAAHSWYLRNTYVENNLIKPGKITLKGEAVDLGRIRQDTYAVGTEKDHIVPWDAAWRITQLFGGDVRFVRASSGLSPGSSTHQAAKSPTGRERTGWCAAIQRSGFRAPVGMRGSW